MRLFLIFCIAIITSTFNHALLAQSCHEHHTHSSTIRFIENKGQWGNNILYKADIPSGAVFAEANQLTFALENKSAIHDIKAQSFKHPNTNKGQSTIAMHSYRMIFEGANKSTTTRGKHAVSQHYNYYKGKDPKKWASNVVAYTGIHYKELYNGIDFDIYEHESSLKYDFTISKGANINNIKIRYEGIDDIRLKDGVLHLKTSINEVTELKPFAFQRIKGELKEIKCNFKLNKNTVSFEFPEGFNNEYEIIIDPKLKFASLSGSTSDNWGYTATYDDDGYLYAGGIVFGTGYPTTIGAYQQTFGDGTVDIAISKYDTTGNFMIYSTYLGGTGTEVPQSLIINNNKELIIYGTTSSTDFPITSNAYDTTFNGGTIELIDNNALDFDGSDMFVSILNNDGSKLKASTYFGGTGNDGLNSNTELRANYADEMRGEVMIDKNNNIYIVSSTHSSDLPTSTNAFQPTFGGGLQDGCIIKFDADLSNVIWCSYLGGSGEDAIYSIILNEQEDICVAGGTTSTNFTTTPGVVQSKYSNNIDGYITKIRNNGTGLISSTYWGSPEYDQIFMVRSDRYSNIYIFGQTEAKGNYFIKNAKWNKSDGGQFISKLNTSLDTIIWSTAFGKGTGVPDLVPSAFMVDLCNKIYLSAWGGEVNKEFRGGNTSGLTTTPDAQQSTTDGSDYYLMVLNDDCSDISYASFFGGSLSQEHVDGGTSRFDRKGNIYQSVCAGCVSSETKYPKSDFPTTTKMDTNMSDNCNNGVFKFSFTLPAVIAEFKQPNTGCTPHTIAFENKSQGASSYIWDFGDGNTSTAANPTHTYTKAGNYSIKLIATNNTSCNFSDSITKKVLILSNNPDSLPSINVCKGTSIQIGYIPSSDTSLHYKWNPISSLSNPNISNPIASPSITTTYTTTITNGVCTALSKQIVNVYDISVSLGSDTSICENSFLIKATTKGNVNSFIWSDRPNFSTILNKNMLDSSLNANIKNTASTFYVKAGNEQCDAKDSIVVKSRIPSITLSHPSYICRFSTDTIHITNNIKQDNLTYIWEPNNSIVSGDKSETLIINPDIQTTYIANVYNQWGCQTSDTAIIKVKGINSISFTAKPPICHNQCNGSIKAIPNGGSSPYTYLWSNSSIKDSIYNLCSNTYSTTITDNDKCSISTEYTLPNPTLLSAAINDTFKLKCNGICNAEIIANASGGIKPYTYLWNDNQTDSIAKNLCVGLYYVTITDKSGCSITSTAEINDTSKFIGSIDSEKQISCNGKCDGSLSTITAQGTEPYQYLWNNKNTSSSITNLCPGLYSVTITDNRLCKRAAFSTIAEPAPLTISEDSIKNERCYNYKDGYIYITPTGGSLPYTYKWNTKQNTQNITDLKAGEFIITITDKNSCTISKTFIISEPKDITAVISTTPTICITACTGSATLDSITGGTAPYSWIWENGQKDSTISSLCSGIMSLTLTDKNKCAIQVNTTIPYSNYKPAIKATAFPDTITAYKQVQLNAYPSKGYTYEWFPNVNISNNSISNPTTTPIFSTVYHVNVTDSLGCENTAYVDVSVEKVICQEPEIFIPNAFSPNGDNKNETLWVRGKYIQELYLTIYNRWGEKVFETTDIKSGWDGTYNGKLLEPDVFVYYLDVKCLGGESFFKKGNITLIR